MLINKSCLEVEFPKGLMISDPPYNQKYHYATYKDNLNLEEYTKLLRVFKPPCVIIGYPEMVINILVPILGAVSEIVCWVYNSNTAKQSRLIAWFGCKPDFRRIGQPYKNPTDKRIAERIKQGKVARGYDWWLINQVKNVSKKTIHPCPLPEELVRKIIVSTAEPGALIMDPFAGSGTVLRVAKDLGYNCFGCELDKAYFNEARLLLQE